MKLKLIRFIERLLGYNKIIIYRNDSYLFVESFSSLAKEVFSPLDNQGFCRNTAVYSDSEQTLELIEGLCNIHNIKWKFRDLNNG